MQYARKLVDIAHPFEKAKKPAEISCAIRLTPKAIKRPSLLDYRAADGQLCVELSKNFPRSKIYCFEPLLSMRMEARHKTRNCENIKLISKVQDLPKECIDVVYCIDIFEHYVNTERYLALELIKTMLKPKGLIMASVPVEIYFQAWRKGLARRKIRPDDWDTDWLRIIAAGMGILPRYRPISRVGRSFPCHLHDFGFDHRKFIKQVGADFELVNKFYFPSGKGGPLFNSKLFLTLQKK